MVGNGHPSAVQESDQLSPTDLLTILSNTGVKNGPAEINSILV